MPASARRHTKLYGAATLTALALTAIFVALLSSAPVATGASLSQLQSALSATNAKAGSLSSSISALNSQVSQLNSQVAVVQSRAAAVHGAVAKVEAAIARDRVAIAHEHKVIGRLQRRLALARKILAAELVSRYEQPQQSLISVVIDAKGFQQMLDQLQFMKRANDAEQSIIKLTQTARIQAQAAAARLSALERAHQQAAQQKLTQAAALDGMQSLLNSRRSALAHIEAARAAALQATRSQGAQLQSSINTVKQQIAAAQQAAQQVNTPPPPPPTPAPTAPSAGTTTGGQSTTTSTSSSGGASAGSYGGWAIPEAIVMCESGGQNLPPNSAGASGYYQIIPGTWKLYGGTTRQAYQASESEQSAVASRIWDGGKGASNWSCAAMVGIH